MKVGFSTGFKASTTLFVFGVFLAQVIFSGSLMAAVDIVLDVPGGKLKGNLIRMEGQAVVLKVKGKEQQIPLALLTARDAYQCIKKLSDEKDAEARFELGKYAAKRGLHDEAAEDAGEFSVCETV